MKNIKWKLIKHSQLTDLELNLVAKLKDQHWSHGIKSQIQWMRNYLLPNDVHLIGFFEEENEISAYLSLVNLAVSIDGIKQSFVGLGNVCVSKAKKHQGLGSFLVQKANEYLITNSKNGILLCKDTLTFFYVKNEWGKIAYTQATISNNEYRKQIMVYPLLKTNTINEIKIDRVF